MFKSKSIILFLIIITIIGFVVVFLYINFMLNAPVGSDNMIKSAEELTSYKIYKANY
ncbi:MULTISPECIES: hypothetical protein [Psychroflexus]|uniref:Uncharacterized protein n=1 Tax=Psychroflexus halocasei TaxID=908615 RepID=A0A1H4BGZ4_9FLAO|nr:MULTISPECIES: hypothetical protein [Psychroflexus]SEA47401.1 hypothetical protein SAMN05421540_10639 [Psychroflexus halocasei]